jgi:ectoine hydroxylase-related dioxygenase (phytanoyl-CoA dioxygenase family)
LAGVDSLMPVLQPGDAVVFDGQVPHRSGLNRSDTPRLTYMVTFVPARFDQARRDYYQASRLEKHQQRRHLLTRPVT